MPGSPKTNSSGPLVGVVIIFIVMIFGALYFWGAHLNRPIQNPPAYIPGDKSPGVSASGSAQL